MEEIKARMRQLLQAAQWTEADARWLQEYLHQPDQRALEEVAYELLSTDLMEARNTLDRKLSGQWLQIIQERIEAPSVRIKSFKWYYAAAIFIVASATALYLYRSSEPFFNDHSKIASTSGGSKNQEIQPGYNQATLTFANGTKINLDSAKSGIQIDDKHIFYNDGTALIVNGADNKHLSGYESTEMRRYLTLSTPRGGQYQLTLSDGTKVWLNAASTLKYPYRFSGADREVEISGEAFFDVAQIKDQPFKVKSRGQVVNVLGTSFNISSYEGDPSVRTTLITGAVQISTFDKSTNQLIPNVSLRIGQQSINNNGEIQIKTAAINSVIAWKSGKFYFMSTPFSDMIQQVARWYNIDVVYKSTVPTATFSGDMKRSVSLMTVLDLLQVSNIQFHIEGRKLVIE